MSGSRKKDKPDNFKCSSIQQEYEKMFLQSSRIDKFIEGIGLTRHRAPNHYGTISPTRHPNLSPKFPETIFPNPRYAHMPDIKPKISTQIPENLSPKSQPKISTQIPENPFPHKSPLFFNPNSRKHIPP